ncbi:hypothetical protein BIV57_08655 [Mangrovactinospora gilvigrisea]|uniref:SPOR domain-containing protein n=1 Tax=Mangrovactinospora gilvigrisea TaxID=1428644 RepID=A0A1J7CE13_9ACTN|nr:hypothetical protein [Mangrovactinospora gilvigrisea]OIV37914.1 hypothetical protein BIV57_08655 [Mangrovactinospora gilvigrisea]
MPIFRRKATDPVGQPGEWYYCVRHHKVEEGPECRAADRLGPYASREEAAHALETAEKRNEAWDAQDRRADDAD